MGVRGLGKFRELQGFRGIWGALREIRGVGSLGGINDIRGSWLGELEMDVRGLEEFGVSGLGE